MTQALKHWLLLAFTGGACLLVPTAGRADPPRDFFDEEIMVEPQSCEEWLKDDRPLKIIPAYDPDFKWGWALVLRSTPAGAHAPRLASVFWNVHGETLFVNWMLTENFSDGRRGYSRILVEKLLEHESSVYRVQGELQSENRMAYLLSLHEGPEIAFSRTPLFRTFRHYGFTVVDYERGTRQAGRFLSLALINPVRRQATLAKAAPFLMPILNADLAPPVEPALVGQPN